YGGVISLIVLVIIFTIAAFFIKNQQRPEDEIDIKLFEGRVHLGDNIFARFGGKVIPSGAIQT
ncbi:MAG: hypothetical protein ACYS6K_25545, partial [Planctomycetota bacterium]